jgi:hypothetical protein
MLNGLSLTLWAESVEKVQRNVWCVVVEGGKEAGLRMSSGAR